MECKEDASLFRINNDSGYSLWVQLVMCQVLCQVFTLIISLIILTPCRKRSQWWSSASGVSSQCTVGVLLSIFLGPRKDRELPKAERLRLKGFFIARLGLEQAGLKPSLSSHPRWFCSSSGIHRWNLCDSTQGNGICNSPVFNSLLNLLPLK